MLGIFKVKTTSFMKPIHGPGCIGQVYDNLVYDEDPHLRCLEPTQDCLERTQHSWIYTRPKLEQSHITTSPIPPGLICL